MAEAADFNQLIDAIQNGTNDAATRVATLLGRRPQLARLKRSDLHDYLPLHSAMRVADIELRIVQLLLEAYQTQSAARGPMDAHRFTLQRSTNAARWAQQWWRCC